MPVSLRHAGREEAHYVQTERTLAGFGLPKTKRRGLLRGVLRSIAKRIELLRHRLLEHTIDLLVRSVAASLAGLSGLQSLVRGALRAVSSRARRLSSRSSRVSSSLSGSGILHRLLGSRADFVYRLLRHAAASRDESQSSKACFQRCRQRILHDFFPLLLGRIKNDQSDKILRPLNPQELWLVPANPPQKSNASWQTERGEYKIGSTR